MTKKRKRTRRTVIRLVQDHLDAVGHGIKFDLVEAGVHAEGEWWQVPVISTLRGQNVSSDVVINIFAKIENDLHNAEGLTVLLVPVVD